MPTPRAFLRPCLMMLAFASAHSHAFAQAVPNDAPQTPEQFAKDQTDMLAQLKAQYPETPARKIDSLLRFDLVEGRLVVALVDRTAPDDLNFAPDGDKASCLQLNVRRLNTQPPTNILSAHLMHFDAPAGRSLNVEVNPAPGTLNLAVTVQTVAGTTTTQMVEQSPGLFGAEQPTSAKLYVSRADTPNNVDDAKMDFTEANFAELVVAHHEEALAMLDEGLIAMHAMHVLSGVSLAEARAIFDADGKIDAAGKREIDAIVADLDRGGSAVLPEMRTRLRKLGPAAAAALSRLPRDHWSVDLSLNVDTLTANLLAGGVDRSASLLASPGRLFDLLYAPDVSIRRDALQRLQAIAKEKLPIDVDADPYESVAQLEALRAKVVTPAAHAP